jgi:hypothetical protein
MKRFKVKFSYEEQGELLINAYSKEDAERIMDYILDEHGLDGMDEACHLFVKNSYECNARNFSVQDVEES